MCCECVCECVHECVCLLLSNSWIEELSGDENVLRHFWRTYANGHASEKQRLYCPNQRDAASLLPLEPQRTDNERCRIARMFQALHMAGYQVANCTLHSNGKNFLEPIFFPLQMGNDAVLSGEMCHCSVLLLKHHHYCEVQGKAALKSNWRIEYAMYSMLKSCRKYLYFGLTNVVGNISLFDQNHLYCYMPNIKI